MRFSLPETEAMAMTMTLYEPAPVSVPDWLTVGFLVLDVGRGQLGIAQLFRDDLGEINASASIQHPTRVLLRPVDQGQPWWAHVADLEQPPGGVR